MDFKVLNFRSILFSVSDTLSQSLDFFDIFYFYFYLRSVSAFVVLVIQACLELSLFTGFVTTFRRSFRMIFTSLLTPDRYPFTSLCVLEKLFVFSLHL